jgi:hypothetical protein
MRGEVLISADCLSARNWYPPFARVGLPAFQNILDKSDELVDLKAAPIWETNFWQVNSRGIICEN